MPARVAELVDALVSNTNGSNTVPVRLRPRVQPTGGLRVDSLCIKKP